MGVGGWGKARIADRLESRSHRGVGAGEVGEGITVGSRMRRLGWRVRGGLSADCADFADSADGVESGAGLTREARRAESQLMTDSPRRHGVHGGFWGWAEEFTTKGAKSTKARLSGALAG